jgi:hypothetical protein
LKPPGLRILALLVLWLAAGHLASAVIASWMAPLFEEARREGALPEFMALAGPPPPWAAVAPFAAAAFFACLAILLAWLARRAAAASWSAPLH